ncbi:MAG TPA: hypothetical protein VIV11_37450 [Kofleriaceae bacterium]
MPDDERRRRRLGDETKERIADLASGWSLDGKDEPPSPVSKPAHTPTPKPKPTATPPAATASPPPPAAPSAAPPPATGPTRSKPRTNPPPPPGSPERKALEDKIVETARPTGVKTSTSANPVAGEARGSAPVSPPSRPSTRSGPQFRRADYAGPATPFAVETPTPAVIVDDSLPVDPRPVKPLGLPLPPRPETGPPTTTKSGSITAATSNPRLAVPVGEFDSGVQTIEQETIKRDAADGLLAIPDKVTPVEDLLEDDDEDEPARGDATTIDPMTARFERGDPTALGGPDATVIGGPGQRISHHSGGTLRPSAALRRKRGLAGDVRYVFTALFGVRSSRRELAELEHRQGLRQTSRRRHLVTLGRAAVITDSFDHPALGKSREQLQAIEDERSRHAGAVSASDAELERVRRDRETKAKQYVAGLSGTDAELAELGKKLEPLEKEATSARKRAQELRESLQRIDKKIGETEALLTSVKGEKLDKAQVLSDIATLKADRQSVLRDEPMIASELDALNPRIAAIEASRNDLRKKRGQLEKSEVEDQRRTSELLEAIGAKRKVVERAAADAEAARDIALFELGDRLYVDRPKVLAAQLSPIDQIDLELGEGDRRAMELKEILSNIDKAKFARGLAMIILVLGVVGSFVVWLLYMLL